MKALITNPLIKGLLVILLLTGCAQLGLAPAQTFDQKLAYAYGTHTAVVQAAAGAVTSKALSKDDGTKVLALADQSRALLDAAKIAGDPTEAGNKLLLATAILTQLQAYLQSHPGSK